MSGGGEIHNKYEMAASESAAAIASTVLIAARLMSSERGPYGTADSDRCVSAAGDCQQGYVSFLTKREMYDVADASVSLKIRNP